MLPKGLISPTVQALITSLQILPGVGPKTAQRMAYHLLQGNRQNGLQLSERLASAMQDIKLCTSCRQFTDTDYCPLCLNASRSEHQRCIVESPTDMLAIEQAGIFKGYYFILHGRLSPLDGIGPNQLGFPLLFEQLSNNTQIEEVILATSTTVEGEATAHYLTQYIQRNLPHCTCSRIAHGVPTGGELGELDSNTLMRALNARTKLLEQAILPEEC